MGRCSGRAATESSSAVSASLPVAAPNPSPENRALAARYGASVRGIAARYGARVRGIRRLLVAFVAVMAGWGAAIWVGSVRGARCNPDDLTDCDTLGSVVLWLIFGLPLVLFMLLIFLVLEILTLTGRRSRSGHDEKDG